ncbi:phosphatidylinositol-binding protein scs2 [Blyttiomyces sp. JEL0837]|nr:phosphatidylinositol-binding protein scs2 [Blyttiomyces sp. JEL0837]
MDNKFIALEPDRDLEFRRPFNATVKQTLVVSNVHPTEPIAFKVKTTAPKQYCVRPNSGRIAPGGATEVQVLLQAMKEDPPLDFKCKDKFLIQSMKISSDVMGLDGDDLTNRLQELWSRAEHLKKVDPEAANEIMAEKKLRCNFLPPLEAGASSSEAAGVGAGATINAPLPTPIQPANIPPARQPAATSAAAGGAAPNADADRELRDAKETIKRLTAACEGYKSEIDRLNLLRQRRAGAVGSGADAGSGDGKVASGAIVQGSGLNVQIVALIALIAFLLGAYLF